MALETDPPTPQAPETPPAPATHPDPAMTWWELVLMCSLVCLAVAFYLGAMRDVLMRLPEPPQVLLDNVSLESFNISDTRMLSGNLTVGFRVVNPIYPTVNVTRERIEVIIFYGPLSLTAKGRMVQRPALPLALAMIFPIGETQGVTAFDVELMAQSVYVSQHAEAMAGTWSPGCSAGFTVAVTGYAEFSGAPALAPFQALNCVYAGVTIDFPTHAGKFTSVPTRCPWHPRLMAMNLLFDPFPASWCGWCEGNETVATVGGSPFPAYTYSPCSCDDINQLKT